MGVGPTPKEENVVTEAQRKKPVKRYTEAQFRRDLKRDLQPIEDPLNALVAQVRDRILEMGACVNARDYEVRERKALDALTRLERAL